MRVEEEGDFNPTAYSGAEKKLWEACKERHVRVFPQYPLLEYRLDFAYFTKSGSKYDIEIDGSYHFENEQVRQRDKLREERIHQAKLKGWKIKRFTAREVLRDVTGVMDEIEKLY